MSYYDRGGQTQTDSAVHAIDMINCGIENEYMYDEQNEYLQQPCLDSQVIQDYVPNEYDGMTYNVECTPNRYDVLNYEHEICSDILPECPSYAQAVAGLSGQTCSSPDSHEMAQSRRCRADPARAPHDTSQQPQDGTVNAVTDNMPVDASRASFSWATPKGKIVSQSLDKLNSAPVSVNGATVRAMLDTGAAANCIVMSYFNQLRLPKASITHSSCILRDAQGNTMKVYGEIDVPLILGDATFNVPCVVVETLPMPIILGRPFMVASELVLDFKQNTLTLNNSKDTKDTEELSSVANIVNVTPITKNSFSFYAEDETVILPNTETTVLCWGRLNPSCSPHSDSPKPCNTVLQVLKSDLLFTTKSLIVKPGITYRQPFDTYAISVINPLSKPVKIGMNEFVTEGQEHINKPYIPSTTLPESIMLEPGNVLDKPLVTDDTRHKYAAMHTDDITHIDVATHTDDVTHTDDGATDDMKTDGQTDTIAGIKVLWPEQPYCPPVQITRCTDTHRTVACQVEVDVGNQTRIQVFKHLDWDKLLKLEEKAEWYRPQLQKILERHRPAFAADLNELAIMEGVYYRIDLIADAHPVNIRTYRMPPAHEKELERQIKILLDAGIIQESEGSLWGAPAFIVYKEDEEGNPIKPRMVIDFKHTNKMLVGVKSPIPKVNDIIDHISAGKNKVFSVVDLASAFYAIQLTPESRSICAINTKTRKFCFNRLVMGAKASPEVFSSLMSRCLSPLDSNKVLNYMDDILIMTETMEEHLEILDELLWRLRQVGLRISPNKVNFMQSSVKYLGFIFDKEGVRADPRKMEALVKLPVPKNVKGVRQIMGCFNYYKRFVKDYSKISLPLNELLRQDEPFVWDDRRQEALDTLKAALLKNAVLYSPDPDKPFIVCLDASQHAIGSVISQKGEDGRERPCVLMSKTLTEAQIKYHSNEKEALALVESLKLCETLMGPNPSIDVYSDNLTTVYLNGLSAKTGRLFRYRMYLNKFEVKVCHKEGRLNCVADMLSRLEYEGQPTVEEEEPDDHALITAAHCPFDEILTSDARLMPTRCCPIHVGNTKPTRFCMFDRFEEHNYPPKGHKHSTGEANGQGKGHNPHKQDTHKAQAHPQPDNQAGTQTDDMQNDKYMNPADVPLQHEDNNDANGDLTDSDDDGHEKQNDDNDNDKGDSFMQDEHGLLFEDWEQIQDRQVNNIYSQILRNTRVLATEQATDRDSADMYQYKKDGTLPEPLNLAKRVMAEQDRYLMNDKGILYRQFQPQPGQKMCHQLVLPAKYRYRITRLFHHGLHGTHRGFHSLLFLVRKRYYWSGIYTDLMSYVASCSICAMAKRDYSHVKTPLHIRKQCMPLEICHMDVLKVSPTRGGEHKVLVMVDRFTKHFEVECIPDEKSQTLARVFLNSWLCRFSTPRLVILDRAAAHMSEVFKVLAEQFNIKLQYIVGYRPQSNSAVERVHSKILVALRACLVEYPTKPWTSFLALVRWSHDMSVQTNGFTPFELLYGQDGVMTGDLDLEPPALEDGPPQDVLEFLWPDLTFMRTAAARNAREAAENMKKRYDERFKTKYKGFRVGDLVWLQEVKSRIPSQYKTTLRYKGPYVLVANPLPGFWTLRISNEIINQLFPEERLKLCVTEGQSRLRARVVTEHAGEHHDSQNEEATPRVREVNAPTHTHAQAHRHTHTRTQTQSQMPESARKSASTNTPLSDRAQVNRNAQQVSGAQCSKSAKIPRDARTAHTDAVHPQPKSTQTDTVSHDQPQTVSNAQTHRDGCARTRGRPVEHISQGANEIDENGNDNGNGNGHENDYGNDDVDDEDDGNADVQIRSAHTSRHSQTPHIPEGSHRQGRIQANNTRGQRTRVDMEHSTGTNKTAQSKTGKHVTAAPGSMQADVEVRGDEQGRYGLRKRNPRTGQVGRKIKGEKRGSSRESESEENGETEEPEFITISDSESEVDNDRSSDSDYLPDIPPVRVRKRKIVQSKKGRKARTHHVQGFQDQPQQPDQRTDSNQNQGADNAFEQQRKHGQQVQAGSNVDRTGQFQKLAGNEGRSRARVVSRDGQNMDVLTPNVSNQHVLTSKKHVGRIRVAQDDGDDVSKHPNSVAGIDWGKLTKIATSKPRANGMSYLCKWPGQRPQWVKGEHIPSELIRAYEKRIRQRDILRQINHAHGNMN